VVTTDGFSAPANAAMLELKRCVNQVNAQQPSGENFDYRNEEQALLCYRKVHHASWSKAMGQLGEAAMPILLAHKRAVAIGTFVNAARTLLMPDGIYLCRPEAPGSAATSFPGSVVGSAQGHPPFVSTSKYERDFKIRLYEAADQPYIHPNRHAGPLAHYWSALSAWYHANIVTGKPLPVIPGDTPYEHWVYFCLLGGVAMLFRPRHVVVGILLWAVMLCQLLPSSFIPGTNPRFAVPIRPIVDLWGIYLACTGFAVLWAWVSPIRRRCR